ncbi:MAG: chromate transporter, partial [Chitinophagales bacterium]|nr:chromate transporter [Chitinophagales bacterium]
MGQPAKPAYKEAFQFWLKLGFISFGGPAGQIAIMHEYLVEKKKWISEKKFLHALNYCMLLPGPEAQQLATYTGWLLHGTKGGLTAGILFILPSVFILLILSILYVSFGNIPWVYALFNGLKPAVVAIVIVAVFKIGKKSLQSYMHYALAALSFIAIFFFNISFLLIIFFAILIGFIATRPGILPVPFHKKINKNNNPEDHTDEEGYYLTTQIHLPHTNFSPKKLSIQIATFMILWFVPIFLFYLFSPNYQFWRQLSVFFTQAAFVTFGGAYAVLPYVAQVS